MIQRIQSVYLLLASLLSLGLAFYFSTAAIQGSLFTLLVENYGFYSLPILCVFILLRFKKRNLQLMLTSLTLLIQVFFLVVVFVENSNQILTLPLALPFLGGVGVLLGLYKARVHIRNDEELVRSVDRIR